MSTGWRSSGGVSIVDICRIPVSAISSVRGIGVAVIVSTSTLRAELLQPLLVRDAEPLLLVDDQQAEVLERDVAAEQPVRADHDVDLAVRRVLSTICCLLGVRRTATASRTRHRDRARTARENVMKCCSASSVVGTSTATCLPSITALNAARTATSVLPKPTSPQSRRSIGSGAPCPP